VRGVTLERVTREIREARAEGLPWPVTPEVMHNLTMELAEYPHLLFPSYEKGTSFTIYGSPIVVIPFTNNPKFKTFQSMAALAGARINYGVNADNQVDIAWFRASDGSDINYRPSTGEMYAQDAPWTGKRTAL
jgi:hypothetical protein